MSSRSEKDRAKQIQDKCQSVLNALLRDEDNKYCVDCDSKGPRWASWNLGVFLCIRCAGIHRNLGVHISKVKSVNLDTWTPEQVVSLQQMGNSRARAVYEANLPDNFRRPKTDTSSESFIRAKYEHKKYIAREWVQPPLPKVDWEKEIDEEIERLKRKKKSAMEKTTLNTVEIPQLPKPKSVSPKLVRVSQLPSNNECKQNADLLGLQNSEDNFSGFLSAPVTEENKITAEPDSLKTEEESFFNQTAPTEKEKAKLTKDNILALYGNIPAGNTFSTPFQNPNFATQQNHSNFATQQNFSNFTGCVPSSTPAQNGGAQFPGTNQPFTNQFPYQQSNQFRIPNQFNSTSVPQQSNLQFTPVNQFPATNQLQNGPKFNPNMQFQGIPNSGGQVNQFQQPNAGFASQTFANPFYSNVANNLPHQLSNMSINNTSGNSGPTVASNLWQ